MITHPHRLAAIGLIAAGIAAASAAEPTVTYLTPETYRPDTGQVLTLRVNAGTPLQAAVAPWPADRLNWFFVRGGGAQQNRPNIPPTARDANAAEFTISHPGVSVIGLNFKPVVVQMSGDELRQFLVQNVAGADRDPRVAALRGRKTVRVRRIESAAALVRAPEPGQELGPSAIALSKLGLVGELRSLMDPTVARPGSDWAARVYIDGSNRSGCKVLATSLADGKTQAAIADASGAARFHIGVGGAWRVEFHYAQPLDNDPQADWVLRSGTLTFEVPTEGAGK